MERAKTLPRMWYLMESQEAHIAGLAKIIPPPPKEWIAHSVDEMIIPMPINQLVSRRNGAYQQLSCPRGPITVRQFSEWTDRIQK